MSDNDDSSDTSGTSSNSNVNSSIDSSDDDTSSSSYPILLDSDDHLQINTTADDEDMEMFDQVVLSIPMIIAEKRSNTSTIRNHFLSSSCRINF